VEPALSAGVALADAAPGTVHSLSVASAGQVIGHVNAPWRHDQVPVAAARSVKGTAEAGGRVTLHFDLKAPPGVTVRPGEVVGHLVADFPSGRVTAPLIAGAPGSGPTLSWKLTHF
jgi:hypothetical protein